MADHRLWRSLSPILQRSGTFDIAYTGDWSALDVYVEYLNSSDEKGFVGIEVKYHENLNDDPAKYKERYAEVAAIMGCFKSDCLDILKRSPLEQITAVKYS